MTADDAVELFQDSPDWRMGTSVARLCGERRRETDLMSGDVKSAADLSNTEKKLFARLT